MHHDWDNNQKVRGNVAVTCPWYGREGCGFKLSIQTFIYKLLPKNIWGVLRLSSMWSGRPFRWATRKWISSKKRKKIQGTRHYPYFWEHLGPVLIVSRNTGRVATVRVITLNVFKSPHNLFKRSQILKKDQCIINYHVVMSIALHN